MGVQLANRIQPEWLPQDQVSMTQKAEEGEVYECWAKLNSCLNALGMIFMMEKRDSRGNSLNLPNMRCSWAGSMQAQQKNI